MVRHLANLKPTKDLHGQAESTSEDEQNIIALSAYTTAFPSSHTRRTTQTTHHLARRTLDLTDDVVQAD
ncbi:hypothetical protein MSAN_02352900 [Mycena sanguinolenta]|uniref:Uncharacterized protein n=1 Tax=Mycena sanguinolenta TaxID=230812 RepID=A0A8H6X6V9_9AGAR|nr:hypothetical protein MSAN_02352900 [Mycena sanguinolenta]